MPCNAELLTRLEGWCIGCALLYLLHVELCSCRGTLYGVTGSFCTAAWQGERVLSEGPNCSRDTGGSRRWDVGGTPQAQRGFGDIGILSRPPKTDRYLTNF